MNSPSVPARTQSWNAAMAASPGPLDLVIAPDAMEGAIPSALHGSRVLSNGPGWTRIGDRTAHPFDGHGYVRSFSLRADGSCHLQAEFVKTPSYIAEADAGHLVHRGFATNAHDAFWKNLKKNVPRNVANTTILRWGDRLLAGWEAGAPYALDPETLATRGEELFGGAIDGLATLAHMRKDHAQGRLVLCNIKAGRNTDFTFREVDSSNAIVATTEATVEGMVFTHDYAMTSSYFILGGNPLRLKPAALAMSLMGAGTLLTAVSPDKRRPGRLHLIPRGGDGPVRTVTLPGPAFVVHFGNAFERDGDLIVDACAFEDFTFGEEFGYGGTDAPFDPARPEARGPQKLYRITVPGDSDVATWELLTPHGVDFPRFHPEHEGVPTPWLFGATRKDTRYSDPFDSIIGVDLRDTSAPNQLWTAPDTVFVGEPLFAPDPEDPAEGHILALLSDGLGDRTTLAIFDAANLAAGPLTRIPFPLLPIAFHGDWLRKG
ncbi:MAG: carotenoid oxygenase family protein [Deltaproteobacteria bacterium]|nr:carotenoid oxygenase family protein [Deltaproteobacteria bacterium]